MGAEKNLDIVTEEAQIWIEDVRAEVDAVRLLLDQVKACIESDPEDDILYEHERLVTGMVAYWKAMIKVFQDANDLLKNVIKDAEIFGNEAISEIKAAVAKHGF